MNRAQKTQYIIKQITDKIIALLLLLIICLPFLLIAIVIKLDSKGPVIFKQQRLGRNGQIFTIYKFRTMCDNAVSMGEGIFISKNDNRITKVGKILRKTSLDEIPQLINVLKGEMSFVGPRPPLEYHPYRYEDYSDIQKLRFAILPGITGYAQAYGRNSIKWSERIKMDVYYYNNFSLLFDIKICVTTVFAVILSRGTYSDRNNAEKVRESLK
jgi:undecaprenyl phosphate N,N'-diacetylbacillosamine 1-phosphate transferase